MATLIRAAKDFKGEFKKKIIFFDKNPYKPKARQGFFAQNDAKIEMSKPLANGHFNLGPPRLLKVF